MPAIEEHPFANATRTTPQATVPTPLPQPAPPFASRLHRAWHAALLLALCAPAAAAWLAANPRALPQPKQPAAQKTAKTAAPQKAPETQTAVAAQVIAQSASRASSAAHATNAAETAVPEKMEKAQTAESAAVLEQAPPAAVASAATPAHPVAALTANLPAPSGDPLAAADAMALVNARASKMVLTAVQLLGTPYRWGGKTQSGGFDCSGLVRAVVMESTGMELPLNAAGQAHVTRPIEMDELRSGDLVFFNTRGPTYSHVGIYVGDGFFIHAPHSGAVVRIEDMHQEKWMRRLTGTHRLPLLHPAPQAVTAATATAAP